ncbi:MAG: 3-dehydroquinate synthase [Lentisphaeria bacterium]|nr:3-dehydroquinate synthase [Lentisphaeria bacterium]NQZ68402.1 3-dehydroquinate synthase [Lentisphaeria bacterium]
MENSRIDVEIPDFEYPILIGDSYFSTGYCDELKPLVADTHCAIICDSNTKGLYAEAVQTLLKNAGSSRVDIIDFPAGEENKNMDTMQSLYSSCVQLGLDRKSMIIALGGGVVGDISGFLAATYMRGIEYIQIPTSLLAQVDSSVGGKTGVDVPEGKNLVGAFKQPKAVLIDITCLKTLPERQLTCGLAEVIKYGLIMDAEFFDYLESNLENLKSLNLETYAHLVKRSCELKAGLVIADERDLKGLRAILNYGHTFGHAIEMLAGFSSLTHGEGISIGMMMAVDLEVNRQGTDALKTMQKRQEELFKNIGLPVSVSSFSSADIFKAMQSDKKYENGKSRLILPSRIGKAELVADVPEVDILTAIEGRCDK